MKLHSCMGGGFLDDAFEGSEPIRASERVIIGPGAMREASAGAGEVRGFFIALPL